MRLRDFSKVKPVKTTLKVQRFKISDELNDIPEDQPEKRGMIVKVSGQKIEQRKVRSDSGALYSEEFFVDNGKEYTGSPGPEIEPAWEVLGIYYDEIVWLQELEIYECHQRNFILRFQGKEIEAYQIEAIYRLDLWFSMIICPNHILEDFPDRVSRIDDERGFVQFPSCHPVIADLFQRCVDSFRSGRNDNFAKVGRIIVSASNRVWKRIESMMREARRLHIGWESEQLRREISEKSERM